MKTVISFACLIMLLAGTCMHLSASDFRVRSGRTIDPATASVNTGISAYPEIRNIKLFPFDWREIASITPPIHSH
ncbi:hypothetical protein E2A64_07550 [Pseudohoeflea suaedae]|uniref:Uncharacterized protein n=1 Tax=Pseudohoeflea suaedae TaxID=877384 RepID=A0A4R5PPF6_9HYPH|nr:hypothetical protein [Pseudohoeflea suaedae]TDH38936.1 hypothetical protein E2A64_07550 [Pseudohoeflea suaedae]